MARPQNNRIVHTPPLFNEFKPIGVKRSELKSISLTLDEYEAIRLADNLGLSHLQASKEMNISRSTFSRLVDNARKTISKFLINGMTLHIEGGNVHFSSNYIKCNDCGYLFMVDIDEKVEDCPKCKSDNLQNMASNYGHGRCCTNNRRRRGGWKQ